MTIDEKAHLLRILGHPVRLKIIAMLVCQCVCVKELWQRLSLPQAVVSQHLSVLKENGIVIAKRNGTRVCYSVQDTILAELCCLWGQITRAPDHAAFIPESGTDDLFR